MRLRADFLEGKFLPPPDESRIAVPSVARLFSKVQPLFTLDLQHYMRLQSDSMWHDLSSFFGADLRTSDPNMKFDPVLTCLHRQSELFKSPFHPFEKVAYPFVICIVGPPGSGRTTVIQLLDKVVELCVIEVLPPIPVDPTRRKRRDDSAEDLLSMEPDFPFPRTTYVRAADDKSTVSAIVQAIPDNQHRSGVAIVGWPNSKTQLGLLERSLQSVIPPRTNPRPRTGENTTRPKTPPSGSVINGIAFTTFLNSNSEKLIDPVTCHVFHREVYRPGFMDLLGVVPREFVQKQREIAERLEVIRNPDFQPPSAKTISNIMSLEGILKKHYTTLVIPKCENAQQLCELLDGFIAQVVKSNGANMAASPLMSLLKPSGLIIPGLSFSAIRAWKSCIKKFGRMIADQSHLVSTLGNQTDELLISSENRLSLMSATSDERKQMCENPDSDLFHRVWESSIKRRNEILGYVDSIVKKSGLLELISQLRKAPNLVFISLIQRVFYMKWFVETFRYLCEGSDAEIAIDFLESLAIPNSVIPDINFQIDLPEASPRVGQRPKPPPKPDVDQDADSETKRIVVDLMFEQSNSIDFQKDDVCEQLGIPLFDGSFRDDPIAFARTFFDHIENNVQDEYLQEEARTSRTLFDRFVHIVVSKEQNLLSTTAGLKQTLVKLTDQKYSREMENFSRKFREMRKSRINEPLFEYDFSTVRPEIRDLAMLAFQSTEFPIIAQTMVKGKLIPAIAERFVLRGCRFLNLEKFLEVLNSCSQVDLGQRRAIELCVRVYCCIACFDVKAVLLELVSDPSDRERVIAIFSGQADILDAE
jgi:hypothetical protein